jgi:hypothetical protein
VPASPNGARAGVTAREAFSLPLRANDVAEATQNQKLQEFGAQVMGNCAKNCFFLKIWRAGSVDRPGLFLSQADLRSQQILSHAYRSEISTGRLVCRARIQAF